MAFKFKKSVSDGLRIIHFLVAMCYLWAGLVEFIRNPPYFDAYGDAAKSTSLPSDLFRNNPIESNWSLMRLMDLPILAILIGYIIVCIWLKFKGLSWILTGCITSMVLCFLLVNFWAQKYFNWTYYDNRMAGLELQVATIALSGTMIFTVLFYKRRRMPFNFKSSLKIRKMGKLHVAWNFCSIYLIMFASMLIWFLRMYVSWACFRPNDSDDLLKMCQATNQVRCYRCHACDSESMKKCVRKEYKHVFSCQNLDLTDFSTGAFCIFNYNMGIFRFLETFAHVGGLSVFLSVFLKITGHYSLRGLFLLYKLMLGVGKKSNRLLRQRFSKGRSVHQEMNGPGDSSDDNDNTILGDDDTTTVLDGAESDEEDDLANATCG